MATTKGVTGYWACDVLWFCTPIGGAVLNDAFTLQGLCACWAFRVRRCSSLRHRGTRSAKRERAVRFRARNWTWKIAGDELVELICIDREPKLYCWCLPKKKHVAAHKWSHMVAAAWESGGLCRFKRTVASHAACILLSFSLSLLRPPQGQPFLARCVRLRWRVQEMRSWRWAATGQGGAGDLI